MNSGFIVIWRKFQETSFYRDSYATHLALHLILEANHAPRKFTFNNKEESLDRGQLITGRLALSDQLGIPPSTIRNKLELLKNVGFLDIKSNSKFSVITICNYNIYQDLKLDDGQRLGQRKDSQRTARGQPEDTNNNTTIQPFNNETIVSVLAPTLDLDEMFKDDPVLKPLSERAQAMNHFFEAFEKRNGKKYIANFDKEGAIVKGLLKLIPLESLKSLIDRFFATDDEFIIKAGFTIGLFKTQINKLQTNGDKYANDPPAIRELMRKKDAAKTMHQHKGV